MKFLDDFFKLEENKTNVLTEALAGATTFCAMAYILATNSNILSISGMPIQGVFLATIFAIIIGTLIMGLYANVPYALAPGMGLNAFFTFTVCLGFGFMWQEALAMVFICGIINIIITVTKIRKHIIAAIPKSLQLAIGGGIGIFIAYIGLVNANIIVLSGAVPAISDFTGYIPLMAAIGLIITIILLLLKVPGAILIGVVFVALIGGITGQNTAATTYNLGDSFNDFGSIFGQVFISGFPSLFSDISRMLLIIVVIFAFSLTDTFDTIGTFIGTGRKTKIFSDEELDNIDQTKGFNTKIEKALFADAIATSVGAVLGTSNTTTYIESSAGIESGGRTGLTSVFTAILFALCIFAAPFVSFIGPEATAPALIIVGIMMASSLKGIQWDEFAEAIPAFFAIILMPLAYNISIGIAVSFIMYVLVKIVIGKIREIHLIMWICSGLFVLYFIAMALTGLGII